MRPFLQHVAHDLFKRTEGHLAHTVVIFPNKRASLFFNRHLLDESKGSPLFAPTYMTLGELFAQFTPLRAEDPIRLVCLLHRIFCKATHSNESVDDFYAWGQVMLADFDDIDKNLVETKGMFRDLKSYRELSSPDEYLTPEQCSVLKEFFTSFHPGEETKLRGNFLKVWEVMGTIYDEFNQLLRSEGHAYDGMLCRDAIEHFDEAQLTAERYVFIGFNVLSKVEEKLFDGIKASGRALFYWDWDHYYMDHPQHEAGLFLRHNIERYGNALDENDFGPECSPFDNLQHLPRIDMVTAPTDNAQASYVHTWLIENLTPDATDTAVVLCDEALVQPVLHALPDNVHDVNVTMGYPMALTSVYHELKEKMECMSHATAKEWLHDLSVTVDEMGSAMRSLDNRLQEEEEALYQAHLAVNNLRRLMDEGILNAGQELLARLLETIFKSTSIPFHGEPAHGLQVMGVLETRGLDFRHLLLLSVNEGMLPRKPTEVSFLPYTLRHAFGLTTIERQTSIYAYYFYRMIQRAERLTLVCNNGTNGSTQQQPSRFITQLMVEHRADIHHHTLHADSKAAATPAPIVIPQTAGTRRKLREHFSITAPDGTHRYHIPLLSPTALNEFLTCTLKFYLHYVEDIRWREEDTVDVTTAQFGTLFHRSAELAYIHLTQAGATVRKHDIEELLDNEPLLRQFVDSAFREKYFHAEPDTPLEYDGIHLINYAAILTYLKQLLRIDATYAPFEYVKGEKFIGDDVDIKCGDATIRVRMGGIVDRMDRKDGITRIIDYKTGGKEQSVKSVEELFNAGDGTRKTKIFQAFYYAWVLCRRDDVSSFSPALLYTRFTANDDYNPCIRLGGNVITDFRSQAYDDFSTGMRQLLSAIFDSDEPYRQTTEESLCRYCDFCALCGRKG